MERKQLRRALFALFLLAALLNAAQGMARETPWGRVRILGYKDTPGSDGRMFAPRAVLTDVPHAKDLDLHLEYVYQNTA